MEPTIMDNNEWQKSVTSEKRLQLVNNLIQAMTTLQKTSALIEQEKFDQANNLENQFFIEAISRADYYYKIAQHVYKIRENSNEQAEPNSSIEIEDLFANLKLNELIIEENNQDFQLAIRAENVQKSDKQDNITFNHVKIWYMLLHAFECIMTNTEDVQCAISYCSKFRNLLIHLKICPKDINCNDYLCNSFCVLLTHWTTCVQENCPLCKKVNDLKTPAAPSIQKEWHVTCTFELRAHLISTLIQAISYLPSPIVASYMQKVEKEIYETANSRSQYYLLLAERSTNFRSRCN